MVLEVCYKVNRNEQIWWRRWVSTVFNHEFKVEMSPNVLGSHVDHENNLCTY